MSTTKDMYPLKSGSVGAKEQEGLGAVGGYIPRVASSLLRLHTDCVSVLISTGQLLGVY